MISFAFGAAALIVLRSFVKAARLSLGAAAMYSSTFFAGALMADELFAGAAFLSAGFFFVGMSHLEIRMRPDVMAASGDRARGAHASSGARCRAPARTRVAAASRPAPADWNRSGTSRPLAPRPV